MDRAIGIYYSGDCSTSIPIQPLSARPAKSASETILIVDGSQTNCNVVASATRLALTVARGAAVSAEPTTKKKLPTIRPRIIIWTSVFTITDGNNIGDLTGADALAIQAVNVHSRLPLVMPVACQNVEDVCPLYLWKPELACAGVHSSSVQFGIYDNGTEMGTAWL